jgi:hypothetical protein
MGEDISMKIPEFKKNLKIFQYVITYYCVTYGCRLKILVNLFVFLGVLLHPFTVFMRKKKIIGF